MRRLGLVVSGVFVLATNVGCATVLNGSRSAMRIEGLPPDATVETLDGLAVVRKREPARFWRDRDKMPFTDVVEISNNDPPGSLRVRTADGTVTQVPARRFVGAGWVFVDFLFAGLPMIVDAGSGSWFVYEDTSLAAGKRLPRETACTTPAGAPSPPTAPLTTSAPAPAASPAAPPAAQPASR